MHVSLKHARRVVLGVAVGALFLAAAPGSGRADIIQICVSPKGRRIVLPLGGTCSKPNRAITWDSEGVVGPSGPQGPKGQQGPQGPTGTIGQMGPQGPVGPDGMIGQVGNNGATGPGGPAGEMGPQGPEGPTGPTGATGPTGMTGASGVNGINGVQFYTLGGGDLGSNVELLFGYQSVLGGPDAASGGNPFCLTNGAPNPTCSNSPIYYGPGNGADNQLESVAVPIDASTVTQLWVQTKNVPGPGESYTFRLCINSDCTTSPVTCTIGLPTATECSDLVDAQKFRPGDTIALIGTASSKAAATEVSWMVVAHQTGGDIPTPPAP
jgi:Collagen triple helix repeat (20 copies)